MTLTHSRSKLEPQPTVLPCSDTVDFLAALPFLIGYKARESLFIVPFKGKRTVGAIRIDLPHDESPKGISEYFEMVLGLLERTGAGRGGPGIVICTERSFADSSGAPWRRFAIRLKRRLDAAGWHPRELALIAADGWTSFLDPGAPLLGRSLKEIERSQVMSLVPPECSTVVDFDTLGDLPVPDPDVALQVEHELRAFEARSSHAPGSAKWAKMLNSLAEACFLSEQQPTPKVIARLIHETTLPGAWMMLAIASLTRPGFIIELLAEQGPSSPLSTLEPYSDAAPGTLRKMTAFDMLAEIAELPPETERLQRVVERLPAIVALAPAASRAHLLAFLAWAWWLRGTQTVAAKLLAQAFEIDSDHGMATAVDRLNSAPPRWKLDAFSAAA